mmetsp:Transcript_3435/g.6443  ORF Transcript_3435/g.6443 Transcript_3435/m.6443 type:complete len:100 (-) Transcript_3435:2980-3279(-)
MTTLSDDATGWDRLPWETLNWEVFWSCPSYHEPLHEIMHSIPRFIHQRALESGYRKHDPTKSGSRVSTLQGVTNFSRMHGSHPTGQQGSQRNMEGKDNA